MEQFLTSFKHYIVDFICIALLMITGYKLIVHEWPKKKRSPKRVRQKTEAEDP